MAPRAPIRAAATAASVPACPAPTTMTSNDASNWFGDAIMMESYPGTMRGDRASRWMIYYTADLFAERAMALSVPTGAPTLFFRRQAYEASGLTRAQID